MPKYRIPFIWGNTWERDHINHYISTDIEFPRVISPGISGPIGDLGDGNFYDKDPDWGDEPLDSIMQYIWRVKTFRVTYAFTMSGTIDLFSHPIGEHTPWSFDFAGDFLVKRHYLVVRSTPALMTLVDDERHLFGKPIDDPHTESPREAPLSSDGFGKMVDNPATAFLGFYPRGRAGFVEWIAAFKAVNWDSTTKKLNIIAHTVDYSGAQFAMPYFFQDVRDFHDPMDDALIVSAGLNTDGQANPAHVCGDATLTIPTYHKGVGDDAQDIGGLDITRDCYRFLNAVTNRGFVVDEDGVGNIDVEAVEFYPFRNSKGEEVYDTETGQLVDAKDEFDNPIDDGHGGNKKVSPFD